MRASLRLARARMSSRKGELLLTSSAALVSSFVISALLTVLVNFDALSRTLGAGGLPLVGFYKKYFSYVRGLLIIVALLSLISVAINASMRRERSGRFYAAAFSLGATSLQRRYVAFAESVAEYLLPCIIGGGVGAARAYFLCLGLIGDGAVFASYVPLLVCFICYLVSAFFARPPRFDRGRSPIEMLREHNTEEVSVTHGWRSSHTFRSLPVERRLAKKSVDYYKKINGRIALMLAGCVMYFVTAIYFLYLVGSLDVVMDSSPHDGVDTTATVATALYSSVGIFLFALAVLGGITAAQTALLIRAKRRDRERSMSICRSVGMTEKQVSRVLKYETRETALRAVVLSLFGIAAILTLL